MRSCLLRSGLARSSDAAQYILSNPKAWLGLAYHAVLEKIAQLDTIDSSVEKSATGLWEKAIESLFQRAAGHTLNHRFGQPQTWPGYHLALASVLIRAKEIAGGEVAAHLHGKPPAPGPDYAIREQSFSAYGGRLVGRPDVIRRPEIIDYKTGGIVEYDDEAGTEVTKSSYVRQLRIYGYLVKETLGWWPERGILLPLAGAGVEVVFTPADCEREAAEAIALLDVYNARLASERNPSNLADPSPLACRWCPYKILCSAFWSKAAPEWSGTLDGAAVEGLVCENPQSIHGGAAVAVTLEIERGTETPRRVQIAPLNSHIHFGVTALTQGDRVRLIGLRGRPDGKLAPTQRTVLLPVADVPIVHVR
jgi:hypothetical protein